MIHNFTFILLLFRKTAQISIAPTGSAGVEGEAGAGGNGDDGTAADGKKGCSRRSAQVTEAVATLAAIPS